jgi:dienelactone hydrolase
MIRRIATVFACAQAFACVARAEDDSKTVRAREIFALLASGDYKAFVATGDATMQEKFPADAAQKAWAGLAFQLGAYQSEEYAKVESSKGFDSVTFGLRFMRGTCNMRIVLNAEGKMTGLWFGTVRPMVEYVAPAYVRSESFREEPVTVSAGQYPLPGTLAMPTTSGTHPAIVLVHGSGPHDGDETVGANKPFRDLAGGLASRGIAVLRYEKRTKEHPLSMPPADWTPEAETIDDAVAAAELLRKHEGIDAKRVYVLGHSLGGMLAPFIAEKDPNFGGIVILAGNSRSILDLIQEQSEYLTKLKGEPSAEDRQVLDKLSKQLEAVRSGKAQEVTEPILGVSAAYWARLHALDQVGTAAKLKMPILVLQGGRDYQVTTRDFELWRKKLADHPNVKLHLFDNLNHLFIAGEGKSTPIEYQQAGHVDEQVISTIAEWVAH